ncbi:signal peptidase I [Candidatus Uhrbacteria bacterium]|nr:signal peptidase I [Candidatus Uhrbacteria bacterium]
MDHEEMRQERPPSILRQKLERWVGPTIAGLTLVTIEVVQIVVIAAAIIIPVRYFLVQPFYVRGASMEPTFLDREYLLIDEISYRFHDPKRGDVVVFRYPRDPHEFFIKRVIGLPGDTVDIRNGQIIITNDEHPDGVILDEPYIDEFPYSGLGTHTTLNPDEYFFMGDNRGSSLDSRNFGPVKREFLIGRVWVRGWPFTRFGTFAPPNYNL